MRQARKDDLETLVRHSLAMADESEGRRPDARRVAAGMALALEDPRRARHFVAESDGHVVGSLFVTFEWSDWNAADYWWIQGVYVEPAWRRTGVYRALHDAVTAAARQSGAADVRLYVEHDNAAAIATYEALGMRRLPYLVYALPEGPRS